MADSSITPDVASNNYNNNCNNYAVPHQRRNPSPLEIPELLDKIFSYVDEATLALSTVLVCRQWFLHNRSRVVREAVVDKDMTDEELDVVVRTQLPVARRLYWFTHLIRGKETTRRLPQMKRVVEALEVKHRRWEEILAGHEGCRGSGCDEDRRPEEEDDKRRWSFPEAPLQELIVVMVFESQIVNLLPSLSHLTVLRIETVIGCEVRLNAVFRACRVLQEVVLRPKESPWNPDPFLDNDDPGVVSEFSAEGGRPLLHLRVFILEYHYIRPNTLLDFLSATPRLTDLQLVRLRVDEDDLHYFGLSTGSFDEEEVMNDRKFGLAYEILETLCRHLEGRRKNKDSTELLQPLPQREPQLLLPLLKNLHLSVEVVDLETMNPQRLFKLCPSLQSSASTDCLGFPGRVYNSPQQRLQMAPQNVVTTLDLHMVSGEEPLYGDELHYYLCESPHLLHLLAPRIQMRVNQMDVYWRMRGTRINATSRTVGLVKPRPGIWACRKLRTLHMAFSLFPTDSRAMTVKPPSDRERDDDGRQYRILYGYLSTVCPSLFDLNLNLELLHDRCSPPNSKHLELRMGFILLTRLRGLERLSFQGSETGVLSRKKGVLGVRLPVDLEIDWMVAGLAEEREVFCSVERQEAWREFWESQEWERLIQRERETDGPIRERHRVVMEEYSQKDVQYQTPKQCTDYERVMKELENLGLLVDVKLLLDEILKRREEGTFRVWPMMRHASVFCNRECPFGRTIAQEFLTRHRPPRSQ